MRVIVLGAGLLGVTSAYYLQQLGHEVTVIDRQATPAAETSFANGGQISVSHAEPWANPSAPLKVLQWLGKEDAPLLFRMRADMRQWLWGLQFLRECTPARTRHNIEQIVRLGTYSRSMLQQLRRDTGLSYDQRTQGILHFYTTQKEFDGALEPAEQMRALGCERLVISADEAVKLEPALAHIRPKLAGATYTAEDESGDANRFARELVGLAAAAGVKFLMSHTVTALREAGGSIDHVEATDSEGRFQRIRGDAFVLAMGSLSPLYAAPLGIRLPIYPAKGYSVTLPVKDASKAHQVSLTDDEFKLVFSRYTSASGDRLRIAGTAELNGYDRDLNRVRCEAIVRRVEELFPGAGDTTQAQFWTGLRPATPSNVPLIGKTKLPNLFLNTGHGTLGWTHACGSGKSIARIVSGLEPEVDFAFTGMPAPKPRIPQPALG
ncbi:D-amino acid dehydrogenase [Variovorax sp. NFACC27]|uniref:D-amino acid dehydrogenase n=1 Tax=unclassified Variovorax TaxID=663243 RepID=UPI000898256A|nr:D-amino-acid dehydrogenase [Variovorax paradoxus]SEF19777.1 D-amino-acid dehydrogenase [Variovorax sp. NFACC28]SEF67363.1 D-amino-acid dehydrogenase [Variovorax sp. NFACC29]SFB75144.1 D-amino-acid dehydrogenase [Variovorax sp. NFACC26]SFG54299.1 D-amino-acid dehydrogenase [Variovorax sp. NFACC27]